MSGVPDSMRSWQILAYDGSLRLGTSPFPKISGPHEVIVKVAASSINTLDVMMTGKTASLGYPSEEFVDVTTFIC